MSDSRPKTLTRSAMANGLCAMVRHLARQGVTHIPPGCTETKGEWMDQIVDDPPILATPETGAEASGPIASTNTRRKSPDNASPPVRTTSVETNRNSNASRTLYPKALPRETRQTQLDQLSANVADCTRCEQLACRRTQTVFGEGNPEARICFFGEGPGADEDRQGRPFVGRAGQLLTKMIEACKFSRQDVYIFNTVKCRPPGNRNPEPTEIENCRSYFESQLDLIQPEYIVCLGLVAAQTLLNRKDSVGRMRGRFHDYRTSKVLVTYHPAYLLRNPSAKRMAWEDLQLMLADMSPRE